MTQITNVRNQRSDTAIDLTGYITYNLLPKNLTTGEIDKFLKRCKLPTSHKKK